MNAEKIKEMFAGKRCAVLGLGISNRPLCDFLLDYGASVTACDRKDTSEISNADALLSRGVTFSTGESYLSPLKHEPFDFVFRSPGIRPDVPEILTAVENGAVLTSEMELFFDLTPATTVGITGSDGKTTTTTLVSLFLEEAGKRTGSRVFLGGNIGAPLLPRLCEMTERDFAVVELSSFQLMTMKRSPAYAVITNLSPNHLNWHTDMDEYVNAKCNIFRKPGNKVIVLNRENETSWALADSVPEDRLLLPFSSNEERTLTCGVCLRNGVIGLPNGDDCIPLLRTDAIRLPGKHNIENYQAAIALTNVAQKNVYVSELYEVARSFTGVPHRLEAVREWNGVLFYNSSIDSSPSRTVAALSAVDRPPVVICGGRDKHVPFAPMADMLCKTAVAVVLTGEAAGQINAAISASPYYRPETVPVVHVPEFDEAVRTAARMARPGEAVLLSPGCTSFDAFRNFEERGERFKAVVNALEEEA